MRIFDEIHEKEVGGKPAKGGYPDMGNGRYSTDLSYDQWYTFNNYQRAHYNYMEQLTPTIIWILISIFYKPLAAAILGFIYFIGRIFYSIGYLKSPNSRLIGALIIDAAFLGLFILSLVTIGNWGNFV
jgi:uncharacterized membrane protein YecN with MAPEG domain